MSTPHPWRELRSLPGVEVFFTSLPAPLLGQTDGTRIWLHNRLLQSERRVALAHEVVHIRRQHSTCQSSSVEASVWLETARWLLPDIAVIGEALAWATTLDEAADDLWVTSQLLQVRMEHLHPCERHYLSRRLEE